MAPKTFHGNQSPEIFTALAAQAHKYTLDLVNGRHGDVWISNYKRAGDCDSICIAAAQTCLSLDPNWMVGIALGNAYLSGKSGRELKAHAYLVYIRQDPELKILIDEPTYQKGLLKKGPGTGHIVSVRHNIHPNTYAFSYIFSVIGLFSQEVQ